MEKETERKLDSILSSYIAKRQHSEKQQQLQLEAEEKFINSFKNVVENMIDLKMKEFKIKLEENGFAAKINYFDENKQGNGNIIYPKIQMRISKNKDSKFIEEKIPYIEFIGNKQIEKIEIHKSTITLTGGTSGRGNSYYFSEFDEKIIEKEILNLIEQIFRKY